MANVVKHFVDRFSVNLDDGVTPTQQAFIAVFVGLAAYLPLAVIFGPSF